MKEKIYKTDKKIVYKEVDGLVYVLDANEGKLRSLNDTASFLWLELKKSRTLNYLVKKLAFEFEVDSATARKDIRFFLSKYLKKGLVKEVKSK